MYFLDRASPVSLLCPRSTSRKKKSQGGAKIYYPLFQYQIESSKQVMSQLWADTKLNTLQVNLSFVAKELATLDIYNVLYEWNIQNTSTYRFDCREILVPDFFGEGHGNMLTDTPCFRPVPWLCVVRPLCRLCNS
jgi:hypothetical protein